MGDPFAASGTVTNYIGFRWVGSEEMLLDTPDVTTCGDVVIGRYGGHTSAGADKNEDGALVWCASDGAWEFAALLDAHFSAESAALVIAEIEAQRERLLAALAQPPGSLGTTLRTRLLEAFTAPAFRARCHAAIGEASCLICARKDRFLWWMSIGDCVLYLLHPKLAALGQFALNMRSFYEWVGHVNTFELAAPCYTTGTRMLLPGSNTILLLTDGLLECGKQPFADPLALYRLFAADAAAGPSLGAAAHTALRRVQHERGRDSATLLTWRLEVGG